jgi:phage replication initiation protein
VRAGVQAPPASNTGVLNTQPGISAKIDWLAWTTMRSWEAVQEALWPGEWVERGRGGYGYTRAWEARGIVAFTDGRDGMGIHLSASGTALAALAEAVGDVVEWWAETWAHDSHLTRLDVAWDDMAEKPGAGLLDLGVVRQSLEDGTVTMRWRRWEEVAGWRSHETWRNSGQQAQRESITLYFGRRGSDAFARMYDKRAEQLAKLAKDDPARDKLPGHWVRVELELRHEAATVMFGLIREAGWMGATRVLHGYLDFRIPGADSNKARWATAPWWDAFLAHAEKATLGLTKRVSDVTAKTAWIERQVARTLAVLVDAGGGHWLNDALNDARSRGRPGDGRLLEEAETWFRERGYVA